MPAIAASYGYWATHGLAASSQTCPTQGRWRAAVLDTGFPYLVVTERTGGVRGHAYASFYRTRPACRFAREDSIYVASGAGRLGVDRVLLPAIGWKHGRWVDSVLMTRPLRDGAATPPE